MIDLRELLDERSANPPSAGTMRLALIEKRIVQRRHRRIAAAAAVVVVLLFGGYAVGPARNTVPDPAVTPSPTPSTVLGFPMFTSGTRLAATGSAPLDARELTVTWTPQNLGISWSVRCDGLTENQRNAFMVSVSARGQSLSDMSCGGGSYSTPDQQAWHDIGFKVGEPATLTVRVPDPPGPGTVAVAIYENVPLERYPFPARPNSLKSLDCAISAGGPVVRSDPADPLRPTTLTFAWHEEVQLHARSQTPGYLHVAVNGERVRTISFWDFEADESVTWLTPGTLFKPARPEPEPGGQVTLTLTPEHVTGGWIFGAFTQPGSVRCR